MKYSLFALLAAAVLVLLPVSCADQTAAPKSQITALQSEVERLTAENVALKKENLRLVMATGQPTVAPMTVAPTSATDKQATGYWMTTSSSKRHNSSCRYFRNSKGRPCGPNDGAACKICGG